MTTTSRRGVLKGLAATGALAASVPGFIQAQTSEPIRLGFQLHRTGIGAAYGRWYERTAPAALKVLNDAGGINGRPVEIVFEDDGTDPKRGAEVVEKFAAQNMDLVFGTLFSHVVMGSAPRAGELQIPYLVCSEGHHVASGALNRWTLQPGITDVKSQVQCHGPLGGGEPRQAGHDDLPRLRLRLRPPRLLHRRDAGAGRRGRSSSSPSRRPRPPSPATSRASRRRPRSSTTSWSAPPSSPSSRSSASSTAPPATREIFGFIDSLEAVDINTPGLEFLDGSHFWEGHPRYKQAGRRRVRDLLPHRRRRRRQRRRRPPTPRRSPPTPTCSPPGRPSSSSRPPWRPPATRAPTTARPWSRPSRR